MRTGEWTYAWPDGTPKARGTFAAGSREGPWSFWNQAGSQVEAGAFLNDLEEGE